MPETHSKQKPDQVLVTGGAGFIGSHLVDALMENGKKVCVLDNLSSGSIRNIQKWTGNSRFEFKKIDLLDANLQLVEKFNVIFHLAANPEVRVSSTDPQIHFQQNIQATFNLLECIRKNHDRPIFVFASSSVVYGEPNQIPTPEEYAPLKPISIYGANKLACEALISAYASTYGFKAVIFRLANIVGPRSGHGLIFDFMKKLQNSINELEILGDGSQSKSYLHVIDCVSAFLQVSANNSPEQVNIYNLGSEDKVNVKKIADIIVKEIQLKNVQFKFTGGVDGGRGWKGDVKTMLLDVSKIKAFGWKPTLNSEEAVTQTTIASILDQQQLKKSNLN